MGLSLDELRSYLLHPEARQSLGIQLTDAEAQQVVADPQSSQSWYAYWQSLTPPAPPAPVAEATAPTALDETAPAPPSAPHGYTGAPVGGFAATPPPAAPPADQASAFAGTEDPYAPTAPHGTSEGQATAKKKRTGLWITLSIVGALLIAAIIVVILAFTTARHWTKTDVAEKPETFHTEEYETGLYNVIDDGASPCFVNQDWTECADAMEAQYAGACADVELTLLAEAVCNRHRTEIDRMRSIDQEGFYVSALASLGKLTRTPETATREVSNDDYEPAVTHEAVCYFEFIGECE